MGTIKIKNTQINIRYVVALVIGILVILGVIIIISANMHTFKSVPNPVMVTKPSQTVGGQFGSIQVDSRISHAEFLFNNTVYYAPASLPDIKAGSYIITAHNEGYQDEAYTVYVTGSHVSHLYLVMKQLTTESSIDQIERTWVSPMLTEAAQTNQSIQNTQSNNPLTQYLPKIFGSVMLDYNVNQDGTVTYVVHALPGQSYKQSDYTQTVGLFIKSVGIDPNTIHIGWEQ